MGATTRFPDGCRLSMQYVSRARRTLHHHFSPSTTMQRLTSGTQPTRNYRIWRRTFRSVGLKLNEIFFFYFMTQCMKTDVSQKNIASNIIPQKAAVCLFEMLVLTYHCKRCHTPKDHNMKLYRHTLHDIYIYIYKIVNLLRINVWRFSCIRSHMKAYGDSGGKLPLIPNIDPTLRWVVSFTLRLLPPVPIEYETGWTPGPL